MASSRLFFSVNLPDKNRSSQIWFTFVLCFQEWISFSCFDLLNFWINFGLIQTEKISTWNEKSSPRAWNLQAASRQREKYHSIFTLIAKSSWCIFLYPVTIWNSREPKRVGDEDDVNSEHTLWVICSKAFCTKYLIVVEKCLCNACQGSAQNNIWVLTR